MKHSTAGQPAPQGPKAHGAGRICCTRRTVLRSIPGYAAASLALTSSLGILAGCESEGKSARLQGGERRPVLNPYRFPDPRVQLTYAAAQKHPQVLDKLYCYCHCSRDPFNHRSLLSCFATTHGAG